MILKEREMDEEPYAGVRQVYIELSNVTNP